MILIPNKGYYSQLNWYSGLLLRFKYYTLQSVQHHIQWNCTFRIYTNVLK